METELLRLKCQAVLLDLDGTLVDSAPRILQVWEAWSARNGIDFEAVVSIMHGRRSIDTIRLVAPWLPAEPEVAALEAEEIRDMHDVHIYPGASELMAALRGSPHAIVTSGSRLAAEARLKYVGLPLPRVLITGDEVKSGKPAPDGYLLAARQLGMDAGDCLVIEDSPVGIEAGKAASMRVIAVASTHAADELGRAVAVVAELGDIGLRAGGELIELLIRA